MPRRWHWITVIVQNGGGFVCGGRGSVGRLLGKNMICNELDYFACWGKFWSLFVAACSGSVDVVEGHGAADLLVDTGAIDCNTGIAVDPTSRALRRLHAKPLK